MSQEQQHLQYMNDDDEIDIWELFEQFKSGWLWWVAGACIGLAGAIGYLFVVPPQYEATAVVQPATIGSGGLGKAPVEPISQTLERLRLTSFYTNDTVKTCQVDHAKDLTTGVKSSVIKGNTLLMLKFRAESVAVAESCLTEVVDLLVASQDKAALPLIKELQQQRALTQKQIIELEKFLAQYDKSLTQTPAAPDIISLLFLTAESKREELLKLQKLYNDQRTMLTEPLTQRLRVLEDIYTSDRPVFPKKSLTVLGGLMGGFFVGLLALFIHRSWRRRFMTKVGV